MGLTTQLIKYTKNHKINEVHYVFDNQTKEECLSKFNQIKDLDKRTSLDFIASIRDNHIFSLYYDKDINVEDWDKITSSCITFDSFELLIKFLVDNTNIIHNTKYEEVTISDVTMFDIWEREYKEREERGLLPVEMWELAEKDKRLGGVNLDFEVGNFGIIRSCEKWAINDFIANAVNNLKNLNK